MFTQLVESGSHRTDLARRGTFFAGTLACYALLLVCAGVASVFAYDAQISRENLDITYLTAAPLPAEPRPPQETSHPASGQRHPDVIERATLINRYESNTMPPDQISTTPMTQRELPKYAPVLLTGRDFGDDVPTGPVGPVGPAHAPQNDQMPVVISNDIDVAPPIRPTPAPAPARPPERIRVSSLVLTGKVISKPVPPYPIIAKQVGVQGVVTVEILIDERGRVISAQATSGHALLRQAAQQAALQAVFSPTQLNGQPVKVSGVITYNFMLH